MARERMLAVVVAGLCLMGARCAGLPAAIDRSINAAEAGDTTAFVSGCGSQPIVGYLYCRKRVGDASAQEKVTFHGNGSNCRADSCVFISVFFPDGSPSLSLTIPKDRPSVSVPWKDLLKKDKFDPSDRGFWPFIIETHWTDKDGSERVIIQEGEIRLRVTAAGYVPLNESRDSPAWAWEWTEGGRVFKITTAGRAYVGNH